MAQLTSSTRDVAMPNGQIATIVELSGSVDPQSLEIFETLLDDLREKGKIRIILDLKKLKYINSTGMGMMVQVSDSFREEGGDMVLMHVNSKIMLVLEMLGLQELFRIVTSEEDALAALAGSEVGPSSIQVRLEGAEGEQGVEAVGVEAVPTIELEEVRPVIRTVQCGVCSAELFTPAPGHYRCPRCRALLEVNPGGIVQSYPEKNPHVVELSVAPEDVYFPGVASIITAAGRIAGIAETAAGRVGEVVEGCLRVLALSALREVKENQQIHLFARPDEKELVVRIYCGGKALASDKVLASLRQGVDSLEYTASPEGNLITLKKSA